jgi:putative acyl-CoA dehydrogenase
VVPGLSSLGERVVGDVLDLANAAEAQRPRLVQYDPWGERIDRIVMAPAWNALHAVAAEEGIVATAYERREGRWSRVHQFARLYLFHPSSALYTCPLAMSDGAARVLELHGPSSLASEVLPRLVSRDPARAWTSGQWMTERTGGSDVSGTRTEARLVDGSFHLYGRKWFTSAVTSEMALALARTADATGLSLFYLETRAADGRPNRLRIDRLKDKLGTRAMPTAELTLEGTPVLRRRDDATRVRARARLCVAPDRLRPAAVRASAAPGDARRSRPRVARRLPARVRAGGAAGRR